MSNLTSTLTIYELLDSLGFEPFKTIMITFILPFINVLATIACSLSAYIFLQRKFSEPSFFYYRVLCFVYILNSIQNILRGLFFSPRYFPRINTYHVTIFHIYYSFMTALLFLYEEVLQMGILLEIISLFSSFVKSRFNSRPQIISLAFFLTCLLIS